MPIEIRDATERLYGNSGLTDDLSDKPAMALLKWAEAQLPVLIAKHEQSGDEAAFDEDFSNLSRIVKGVNRIVAKAEAYSSEQLQNRMGKLLEWTQELGIPSGNVARDAYLAEMDGLNEMDKVVGALKVLGTAEVLSEVTRESVVVPPKAEADVTRENAIVPVEESEMDIIIAPDSVQTDAPYDEEEDEDDTPLDTSMNPS